MRREDLGELIRPILEEEGFELVECTVSRTTRSQTFRVAIDRESGLPVEACAQMSRRISALLDGNPMLRGTYQLEVSSPGMNRPVWSAEHFRRFRGERIRLELADPGAEPRVLLGEIGPLEEDGVHILLPGGAERVVRLAEIGAARVQIDPWRRGREGEARRAGSQRRQRTGRGNRQR